MAKFLILVLLLSLASKLSAFTLPQNYTSTRPNQGSVADVVNVSVELLAVGGVHEATSEMTLSLSLQTSWVDSRLFDLVSRETLFAHSLPKIWMPSVVIANAIVLTDPSTSGGATTVLQLNRDGLLQLSQKITARVSCPISMAKYPFDRQVCRLQLNSYGHSSVHLVLFWHGTISQNVPTYHPEFSFSYAEQTSENLKTPSGAEYSNLYLEVAVTRCPLRVIFRAMLPSLCLLFLSYYVTFCHCPLLFPKSHKNPKSPPPVTTLNGHHSHNHVSISASDSLQPSSSASSSSSSTVNSASATIPIQLNSTTDKKLALSFLSPPLNRLIVAINGFTFFLLVILAQLNFTQSPKSSAVSGLDVWLNFMMTTVFVILWHSIQVHLNDYKKSPTHMQNTNGFLKNECSGSASYINRITAFLKLAIPAVAGVFLVAFFGIYLS